MTTLAVSLSDYLTVRRALGTKMNAAEQLLRQFVSHCETCGITVVTSEVAEVWAMLPENATAAWWETRLSAVRPFARWLQAYEPATEVPDTKVFGLVGGRRAVPYIYDELDILALMKAAANLRGRMSRITYPTLIGLLAVTGMRIGEAIRLNRDDLDWKSGTLRIENSKFGKSRLLVLHSTTVEALNGYAKARDILNPDPKASSFLVSREGTRLFHSTVTIQFHKLLKWAGLETPKGCGRPRVHDLRHTFAVKTLRDWHVSGVDVEARLPLLSTYMGHVKPKDTYWYLSASPDLLSAAAERLVKYSAEDQR